MTIQIVVHHCTVSHFYTNCPLYAQFSSTQAQDVQEATECSLDSAQQPVNKNQMG